MTAPTGHAQFQVGPDATNPAVAGVPCHLREGWCREHSRTHRAWCGVLQAHDAHVPPFMCRCGHPGLGCECPNPLPCPGRQSNLDKHRDRNHDRKADY